MIGFCKHAYCVVIMCRWCVDKLSRCWWLWWKRCTVKFFKHLSWSETFLSHWRQPEVYVLAFSTFSCPTNKLQSSHFSSYNLTFWMHEKGVIRIKKEKSRLPVDVRGSKTSVLKLPNRWNEPITFTMEPCQYGHKRVPDRINGLASEWRLNRHSCFGDKGCPTKE